MFGSPCAYLDIGGLALFVGPSQLPLVIPKLKQKTLAFVNCDTIK